MRTLITKAQLWVATRKHHEHGANMVEYGLLVTLIAAVAFLAVNGVGISVQELYAEAADMFP